MAGVWPLVGRDEELRLVEDALACSSALIAGAAGVGKSRLAAEVVDRIESSGRPVGRCVANRSTLTVPFGAMVNLLPPSGDGAWGITQVLSAMRHHINAGLRGGVVLVDDAHLLDDASATLVQHLVRDGHVAVLAVVRSFEPTPEAIEALWKDGIVERVELQPLSLAETRRIVEAACQGPVSDQAVHRLYATSLGNSLFLRELILEAEACGDLTERDGVWWWSGGVHATPRLTTIVERRTEGLSLGARRVLELVAMVEPLPVGVLERLTEPAQVESAERAGVVAVGADGLVRVGHPLFGEVAYALMGTTVRRRNVRALAAAMFGAAATTPSQATRLAILHLDSGEPAPCELLATCARHAIAIGDPALGERLARAAIEVDASSYAAQLSLALALGVQRRFPESAGLLASLEGNEPDEVSIAELAYARMGIALFGSAAPTADPEDIVLRARARIEDRSTRSLLDSALAEVALNRSDLPTALRRARRVLDGDDATTDARLLAAHIASLAESLSGHPDRGVELAERFWPTAVGAAVSAPNARGWMLLDRWLGLMYAGRFDEVRDLCDALTADPAAGAPGFEGSVALFEGRLHLLVGRPASAEARLREAVGVLRVQDSRGYLEWALGLLGAACAQQGRPDEARRALDESERGADGSRRLFDGDRRLAASWVLASEGRLGAARELAESLGNLAVAAGQTAFGMLALHDAVRLGAMTAVSALIDASMRCDSPMAAAIAAHACAVRLGEADDLAAAGQRLSDVGLCAAAAEAHIQAAAAYQHTGRSTAARAESARADAVLESCEGLRTPVTTTRALTSTRLTPRELEVAWLAARGASNAQIAARLFTSRRTVEGHLLRAYAKLGISRRQDLRSVLGSDVPKNA